MVWFSEISRIFLQPLPVSLLSLSSGEKSAKHVDIMYIVLGEGGGGLAELAVFNGLQNIHHSAEKSAKLLTVHGA
jgi:hypothetical protein